MIYKHGKDPKKPVNYRPISLLNTLAKTFEILLTIRLKPFLIKNIRLEQFEFRPQHSTTSQLTKFVDYLTNSTNCGKNRSTIFGFQKGVWQSVAPRPPFQNNQIGGPTSSPMYNKVLYRQPHLYSPTNRQIIFNKKYLSRSSTGFMSITPFINFLYQRPTD